MRQRFTVLFVCTAVIFSLLLQGCRPKVNMAEADKYYRTLSYYEAAEAYKKLYPKIKDKEEKKEVAFKAAEAYRMANKYKEAEQWYDKAIKAKFDDPIAIYRKAQMMKAQCRCNEAMPEFKKYLKQKPDDKEAQDQLKGCEMSLIYTNNKDSTRYIVENFKIANTKYADFAPAYASKKKDQIYITSDRPEGESKQIHGWTGNGFSDIWEISQTPGKKKGQQGTWKTPTLLAKGVNTKYNDGTVCWDAKFQTMYFTQCNNKDGKGKGCKLYSVTKQGTGWDEPQILPFCAEEGDTFNYGHPSISADGSKLYYSSDRDGGFGEHDLYFSNFVKRGKTWSDPINLGSTINTSGDEVFPFIHPDGTLYFSSDGHTTFGELDIFMTTGTGDQWSEPENLKWPVNTCADDFAFICDDSKEAGYFSSNRDKGKDDDIYSFTMTPLIIEIEGIVTDCGSKKFLANSTITLTSSSDTGKIIIKTDKNGYYKTALKVNTDYELFAANREKYYFDSKVETATTRGIKFSTTLKQDFCLESMIKYIKVLPVYYGLDSANIHTRAESMLVLDSLVMTLKEYPRITIELGSHTDCRNTMEYNQGLSQRRADSAVAYITSKGIDPDRIVAKGYGETQLKIAKCACEGANAHAEGLKCTEKEHQMNRRTEVKITGVDFEPKPKSDSTKKAPGAPKMGTDTTKKAPGVRPGTNNPGTPKTGSTPADTAKKTVRPAVRPGATTPGDTAKKTVRPAVRPGTPTGTATDTTRRRPAVKPGTTPPADTSRRRPAVKPK